MAEDLSLSLRPWPQPDTKDSLPFLISRINEQRGSFRNVTEASLVEEIRALEAGEGAIDDQIPEETAEIGQDIKSQREALAIARLEIFKQVELARMESSQALNFVSLLLSKHTPAQAQLTLDPYFKQNVPMGSLGAEVMQIPQVSEVDKHETELVSIGWRMQSLRKSADLLLGAATRLEQEMGHEARYWEQVLAIKESGWSICRMPREKHTLAVRYGFTEAYSDFRDHGLAALRRDEEGNIKLRHGIKSKSRRLRIRMIHQGEPIVSTGKTDEVDAENMPIERLILHARNCIFDEELYQELNREACNLANQGVRCIGDAILLPYGKDRQIEIDLIPVDRKGSEFSQTIPSNATHASPQSDQAINTITLICLRILLSHTHNQNLAQRSQPPQPVRETKNPRPIYTILKPTLEMIRHRSDVQDVRTFLEILGKAISQARLEYGIEELNMAPNLKNIPSLTTSATTSATEALVKSLTAPLHSSISILFPSKSTSIKIEIHTNFFPPTIGTSYQVTITSSPPTAPLINMPQLMQFSVASDLEDYVHHLLKLDIVWLVLTKSYPRSTLTIVSSHEGRLVGKKSKSLKATRTFTISVEKGNLALVWQRTGIGRDSSHAVRWGLRDESDYLKLGLLEVIEQELSEE